MHQNTKYSKIHRKNENENEKILKYCQLFLFCRFYEIFSVK